MTSKASAALVFLLSLNFVLFTLVTSLTPFPLPAPPPPLPPPSCPSQLLVTCAPLAAPPGPPSPCCRSLASLGPAAAPCLCTIYNTNAVDRIMKTCHFPVRPGFRCPC
ncbi:hypothetical protein V6N13_102337 [Hibiscus sabdariffa]|uniref:Bifunctional inhibitor/plant lipid transfer protein/seed storage helical domain-containing protein n=1 Tax=Hibiscus sabdariffa TaxID=183260 RepID=A0ABR2D6I3_9ROSI